MGPLIIAFVVAWALRHWWDGRRNDHRNPDNAYRSNVRNAAVRGANRRYSLGWGAYQLRHGWGPMKQDVLNGWHGAQKATRQWKYGDGQRPAGPWQAVKDGWTGGEIPDPNAKQPAVPQPADNTKPATPATPAAPNPAAPQAPTIVVINNPPSPNGGTMTTPTIAEVTTLDAYRHLLRTAAATAIGRIDEASRNIAAAETEITQYDTAQAQLTAAGLGPQTTGGLADLLESAQQRKRSAETERAAAEQSLASANALLAALDSTGQTTMQDAAAGATERANSTDFYVPQ